MEMEIKDVVLVLNVVDDEDGGEGGYSVYEMMKGEKRVSVLFSYDWGGSLGGVEIVEKNGGEFSGYGWNEENLRDVFNEREESYLWGMGWDNEDWEE